MHVSEKVRQTIRDVKDYPKPGIVFKDITPVLGNPSLFRAVVREMLLMLEGQKIDAIAAV